MPWCYGVILPDLGLPLSSGDHQVTQMVTLEMINDPGSGSTGIQNSADQTGSLAAQAGSADQTGSLAVQAGSADQAGSSAALTAE